MLPSLKLKPVLRVLKTSLIYSGYGCRSRREDVVSGVTDLKTPAHVGGLAELLCSQGIGGQTPDSLAQ